MLFEKKKEGSEDVPHCSGMMVKPGDTTQRGAMHMYGTTTSLPTKLLSRNKKPKETEI